MRGSWGVSPLRRERVHSELGGARWEVDDFGWERGTNGAKGGCTRTKSEKESRGDFRASFFTSWFLDKPRMVIVAGAQIRGNKHYICTAKKVKSERCFVRGREKTH